jgi:MFS family permease
LSAAKVKFSGYTNVIAVGIILVLHLGAGSTSAVAIPAVIAKTGIPLAQIVIMVTCTTLSSTLFSLALATPLMRKIGPKWCMLAGTFLVTIHFLIFSTITDSALPLYIGGIFNGAGLALGTAAAGSALVGSWFIEKRAHMLGVVFGVAAIGAGLWQILAGHLITAFGVNATWQILATVIFVVGVGSNLLFMRTPEMVGQKPLGWEKFEQDQKAAALVASEDADAVNTQGVTLKTAQRSVSLWLIFAAFILAIIAINTYRTNLPTFLTMEGFSQIEASTISGVRQIAQAIFVLFIGFIIDKAGLKKVLAFMMGTMGIALLILGFNSVGFGLVVVSVALSIFGAGSGGSLVGIVANDAFGNKDFAAIQTFIMAATFIAGSIAPLITSGVLQLGGELTDIDIIMAAVITVATILFLIGLNISPMAKARKAAKRGGTL